MSSFGLTEKRKRIFIVWALFHGFALFVTFFGIEGSFTLKSESKTMYISAFSDIDTRDARKHFWPFVNYQTDGDTYYNKDYYGKNEGRYWAETTFHGVFAYYDFSEFIAYMILLLVFFYLKKPKLSDSNHTEHNKLPIREIKQEKKITTECWIFDKKIYDTIKSLAFHSSGNFFIRLKNPVFITGGKIIGANNFGKVLIQDLDSHFNGRLDETSKINIVIHQIESSSFTKEVQNEIEFM